MTASEGEDWIAISASALSAADLTAWVTRANCGGVVTFSGTVRDHSAAHAGVEALEYETDEALAMARLYEVVGAARERWPDLGAVAAHHRVGRVELTETSVVVAVSAPHRGEAFDAARFIIDTLKSSVPMWKREVFEGGSAWSQEAVPIDDVPR